MLNAFAEKLLFLYKFARSPKQIGSVTPSSGFLGRTMTEPVNWGQIRAVAELGAGTGAITRHIASARRPDTRVVLFEKDPSLRSELRRRYPQFGCHADACGMDLALRREGIGPGQLDCVLSGLPFFNFPQRLRDVLLDQIVAALKPDGLFVAFQYSRQMKKQLDRQFVLDRVAFVPLNVPPAFVYVCRKRGCSASRSGIV